MNNSFSRTPGENEENINSRAAGILGLLSDVNLTKIRWQFEDPFADALEVYPLKFSTKKMLGWGLFHLVTGLSFLPVYIFFPILRKTLLFDVVPHPKNATHFLVRSAGYLFHVRRRLYAELGRGQKNSEGGILSRIMGQFVVQGSTDPDDSLSLAKFEHGNMLYFFDEAQKAFRICGGDLRKYSNQQVRKLLDILGKDTTQNPVNFTELAADELVILEDICFQHSLKNKDKSSRQLRSLWLLICLNSLNMILYLLNRSMTLFAVAAASTLFTLVFLLVPKFIGDAELPEGLSVKRVTSRGQVQQLRINQSELQSGDLLTYDTNNKESILVRFQGLLLSGNVSVEGQPHQVLAPATLSKPDSNISESHQSKVNEGDLLVIQEGGEPAQILVIKSPNAQSSQQNSRSQLTEALTRTVYFLFIPLWCMNILYYVTSGVAFASLLENILISFCPFLIFAPYGPDIVSSLRRFLGERKIGSDFISVDDHMLDLVLERPNRSFDVQALKLQAVDADMIHTIKLPASSNTHIPNSVPDQLKNQILSNKLVLEHLAISDSCKFKTVNSEAGDALANNGYVPTLRLLEFGKSAQLEILGYQSGSQEQIEVDFMAGFSRLYLKYPDSECSVSFKLLAKKGLTSYKSGSSKSTSDHSLSSALIHPVDTVFESWASPWLFQTGLARSGSVLLLDVIVSQDWFEFILITGYKEHESSATPKSAGSSPVKSTPVVKVTKLKIDAQNPDSSILSELLTELQTTLNTQQGEFIISGSALKLLFQDFPHIQIERLCISQISKSKCHFVDVTPEVTASIQRLYLRTGKLVQVQDKQGPLKDIAESRLCFSVGVAIFKMICSISLMELTTANFLTQAKSTLSERQLLCPYILVLLPMMIVSVFTKKQVFLIDEGTKKFFRHERLVISVFGNYLIQLAFQNLMMKALRNQFFYVDPLIYNLSDHSTFDNASLFKLNLFLSLGTVAAYSIEDPFKSTVWKNRLFGLLVAYQLAVVMSLTWFNSVGSALFGVASLPLFFNTVVVVIGFLSMLAVVTFEDKIVNRSIIWQFFDRVFQ